MGTRNRISTANDNAPLQQAERYASGRAAFIAANGVSKRPSPIPQAAIPDMPKKPMGFSNAYFDSKPTNSLQITLLCWSFALVMTLAVFVFGMGTAPKILASLALLWTGLWSSYVSSDHGFWRLSELSIVSAMSGLLSAIMLSANYFGLGLTLGDGLILMSILPLALGALLKSRICVLASICASLLWATLSFSGFIPISTLMMAFPLILGAQLFLATKIQSGLAISLSVITAYYWLASFFTALWGAGELPLTFALALLFIIGAAHHRSGKAAEDAKLMGSSIHIYTGWIASIIGAIGFQYFWLNPDAVAGSTATLSAVGMSLWKGVIVASLAAIFISGVTRYKHAQITLPAVFLLTLTSALLPLMLWFPQWPQNMAANIAGLSAVPAIGVFMGAAIIAAALGMAINGARRNSRWMMGMALFTLVVEAFLLIQPHLATLDNVLIFLTGLIMTLAVSGAIAGTSLAHQAPAPRFKHS